MEILYLPTGSKKLKVIQVILNKKDYLIFQNNETYHKDMLVNFLNLNNIVYHKNFKGLPDLFGSCYQVIGMGWAHIDYEDITISFYGSSYDYKISINSDFFKCQFINRLRVLYLDKHSFSFAV